MQHRVLIVDGGGASRDMYLKWLGEVGLDARVFNGPMECLDSDDWAKAEMLCLDPVVLTNRAEFTALDELIRSRGRLSLLGMGDSPADSPLRLLADAWLQSCDDRAEFLHLVEQGIERSNMLGELSLLGRNDLRSRSSVETAETGVRETRHRITDSDQVKEGNQVVELLDPVNGRMRTFESLEMEIFNKARRLAGGNVTRTAAMLGVGRATIYRRMRAAAERGS